MAVSFEGKVTQFVYDPLSGALKQKKYFNDLTAYNNGAGTPAEVWTYKYDAFGRQVEVDCVTGTGQSAVTRLFKTAYNALGNVVREESPQGVVSYAYDLLGRRTKTTIGEASAPESETDYGYDTLGRLMSIEVVERNGTIIDSNPHVAGNQPESTRDRYDIEGNLVREELANGVVKTYAYDQMNRLTALTDYAPDATPNDVSNNAKIAEFDYTLSGNGRRSAATEHFWLDENGNTVEVTNQVNWTYDNLDRLTDEVFATDAGALLDPPAPIDGSRPWADYHDHYVFDLASNRLEKTTDRGNDNTIDETVDYTVDANDRLMQEIDATSIGSTTTDYGYDHTQQTAKSVFAGAPVSLGDVQSSQAITYDLAGRMQTATVTMHTAGAVTKVERLTYGYDEAGTRVSALDEIDTNADGAFETHVLTEYVNDAHNFVGYSQVVRETQTDPSNGQIQKVVEYAIGLTRLSQATTVNTNGVPGAPTTLYFGQDGHGSTRILFASTGAVATVTGVRQLFHYDAYGNAVGFTSSDPGSTFLYNGEAFDTLTKFQALRARYYQADTGRFTSLDPANGNTNDPQSLHTYLYANGDPISLKDPLGRSAMFFDGTNNWETEEDEGVWAPTNVWKMWKASTDKNRHYMRGPGNQMDGQWGGGPFGRGMGTILENAMALIEADRAIGDRQLDIVGFSRGGIAATEFAWRVAKRFPDETIRFVGLFDPVGSVGYPGMFNGYRTTLPPGVGAASEALAFDEDRDDFPGTFIHGATHRWFHGVHSDIGGGYANRGLSDIALTWMMDQGISAGVGFNSTRLSYLGLGIDPIERQSATANPWWWLKTGGTGRERQIIDGDTQYVYPAQSYWTKDDRYYFQHLISLQDYAGVHTSSPYPSPLLGIPTMPSLHIAPIGGELGGFGF